VKNCEDRDGKIIEKVERDDSMGSKKRENKENRVCKKDYK
jgi:hypothetical protein